MKFGVREICNVVFKAKADMNIGSRKFKAGQPVLLMDSAKTSTIEGAATTVYAQGGRGNARLLAWEGEKTLTFTVEDALLSPISFSMLSGAGVIDGANTQESHVHMTTKAVIDQGGTYGEIELKDVIEEGCTLDTTAPIFVTTIDGDDSITGELIEVSASGTKLTVGGSTDKKGTKVLVDYYVLANSTGVTELQIDVENFAGYFYVEANTLFRRKDTGLDMPAEITFPNVKIQSNFTFSMASSGDPSTFTFTMDAFPGYTYFNPTKEVLCAMQIIDTSIAGNKAKESVFLTDAQRAAKKKLV